MSTGYKAPDRYYNSVAGCVIDTRTGECISTPKAKAKSVVQPRTATAPTPTPTPADVAPVVETAPPTQIAGIDLTRVAPTYQNCPDGRCGQTETQQRNAEYARIANGGQLDPFMTIAAENAMGRYATHADAGRQLSDRMSTDAALRQANVRAEWQRQVNANIDPNQATANVLGQYFTQNNGGGADNRLAMQYINKAYDIGQQDQERRTAQAIGLGIGTDGRNRVYLGGGGLTSAPTAGGIGAVTPLVGGTGFKVNLDGRPVVVSADMLGNLGVNTVAGVTTRIDNSIAAAQKAASDAAIRKEMAANETAKATAEFNNAIALQGAALQNKLIELGEQQKYELRKAQAGIAPTTKDMMESRNKSMQVYSDLVSNPDTSATAADAPLFNYWDGKTLRIVSYNQLRGLEGGVGGVMTNPKVGTYEADKYYPDSVTP